DKSKDAIAPYGSFFWFRYDALKAFYARGWEYDDFPAEPLPEDGTISHAIERIRPFVAQQAGYYTAFVMSDKFSRIEYTNLRTYVEDFQKVFFDRNIYASHYDLVNEMGHRLS
ncbi:MAG: rhamnan synthesis F family protein, partial [Lachnospiraceae bacterium]|nr:rhamnan synthesis F family protein [Lachnospiraceae bacterium]